MLRSVLLIPPPYIDLSLKVVEEAWNSDEPPPLEEEETGWMKAVGKLQVSFSPSFMIFDLSPSPGRMREFVYSI